MCPLVYFPREQRQQSRSQHLHDVQTRVSQHFAAVDDQLLLEDGHAIAAGAPVDLSSFSPLLVVHACVTHCSLRAGQLGQS